MPDSLIHPNSGGGQNHILRVVGDEVTSIFDNGVVFIEVLKGVDGCVSVKVEVGVHPLDFYEWKVLHLINFHVRSRRYRAARLSRRGLS